jgi:hypothetical protein
MAASTYCDRSRRAIVNGLMMRILRFIKYGLVIVGMNMPLSEPGLAEPLDGAAAASPLAGGSPGAASAPSASSTQASSSSDVTELEHLIAQHRVAELRTSYNGSYGASLLFDAQQLTYYVVLFEQKLFWRVIPTKDEAYAESVFAAFEQDSKQLAEVEIERMRLEAQEAHMQQRLAVSQRRVQQLQADLAIARAQQAAVSQRQLRDAEQAKALAVEQHAVQIKLDQARHHIDALEQQNTAGLPDAESTQAPR